MKDGNASKYIVIAVYIVLFVLISLFVFVANDENQPIKEIFLINYLIPVLIYSLGSLLLSLLIFQLLSLKINRFVSFPLSLIIGIPLGLKMIEQVFIVITALNM